MRVPFKRGLNFKRRRRKVEITTGKSIALWVVQIVIVIAIAFVCVYCLGLKATVIGNSMTDTLKDGDKILVNRFVYALKEPKAGDVIVFYPNGNERSHYYVKRVIAVPGDTVEISDGVVYVNGYAYDEEDTEVIEYPGLAQDLITVAEDEYFVLGDNRNDSEDSRYANIGNIPKEHIVGKAWFKAGPDRPRGRIK